MVSGSEVSLQIEPFKSKLSWWNKLMLPFCKTHITVDLATGAPLILDLYTIN